MLITAAIDKGFGAPHTEALKTYQIEQTQCIGQPDRLQVIADRMDTFKRLERGFSAVGWNLFNLDGDSCVAVHRKWQMSQVCPDLRAAAALLKRVGGAAV